MEWEASFIEWLQANFIAPEIFSKCFDFFGAELGIMTLVMIIMFCWKKKVGQKLALIVSCLNLWLPIIKSSVLRKRPYMKYPDRIKPLALPEKKAAAMDVAAQGYSFPSMHSASVPVLYFTLAKEAKKKWVWVIAAFLTVLVGFSRVVAGMHYPTDVLVGWTLGFAVMGIFSLLDRYVHKEWLYHLILLLSTLPGIFFVRTSDYFTSLGCLIGSIAAIHFEQRFVNFQETRKIPAITLRVFGAFFIYFVVNTLLKVPFDKDFLASASLTALLIRTARYAINMFLITGVYPLAFPLFEKIGKEQGQK